MTAFDPVHLEAVADALGSWPQTRQVAETFLRLLPDRVTRLADALDRRDPAASVDAVLSLRSSAAGMGLAGTAASARRVEAAVRAADYATAFGRLAAVRTSAERGGAALRDYLDLRAG